MIRTGDGRPPSILELVCIVIIDKFLEKPSGYRKTVLKIGEAVIYRRELHLSQAKARENEESPKQGKQQGFHDRRTHVNHHTLMPPSSTADIARRVVVVGASSESSKCGGGLDFSALNGFCQHCD
jgi:hypothetical protein